MAFRPNYRQQRSQRDRSAKSRQEEKLQKLQERAAKRKAEREGDSVQPSPHSPSKTGVNALMEGEGGEPS